MLKLELTEVVATLANFNARTEKNGSDRVPAASLKFSCNQPPDVLAHFAESLKGTLFTTDKDLGGDTYRLRDTGIVYPMNRSEEMYGCTLRIGYGIGNPIELPDSHAHSFEITPLDGGTVKLVFTVNCKPDADKDVPVLYRMQAQGVQISLEPAEELAEADD